MPDENPRNAGVTELLHSWSDGDVEVLKTLMPLVFADLKRIARHRMASENSGHTLQPTALVNEVYLRLAQQQTPQIESRSHFFAYAGRMMRWILVDHARRRRSEKRGGDRTTLCLDDDLDAANAAGPVVDILALDEAMTRLEELNPRQSRIVELKFFAGLTIDEISEILDVSVSTVKDDWRTARAWLFRRLTAR